MAGVNPDNVMPKKGSRLTPEQIGLLRAWIDQGLPWDNDVTFARQTPLNLLPRAPKLSVSVESGINPIDQILKPYFHEHQFRPPPVVEDRLFARRAYLDVIGLLPPTDGPGSFVTDDDPRLARSFGAQSAGRQSALRRTLAVVLE